MSTVPCAFCSEYVGLDQDHVSINATIMHTDDRNERDDYYAHVECFLQEARPTESIEETGDAEGWSHA